MIFDTLSRLAWLADLSPNFAAAIRFLNETELAGLPVGRQVIAGDAVYANVMRYDTKPPAEARWESHRRYADIQVIVEGEERIGVRDTDELVVAKEYDDAADNIFYAPAEAKTMLTLKAGDVTVFLPHDGHWPSMHADGLSKVFKVVVKVAV